MSLRKSKITLYIPSKDIASPANCVRSAGAFARHAGCDVETSARAGESFLRVLRIQLDFIKELLAAYEKAELKKVLGRKVIEKEYDILFHNNHQMFRKFLSQMKENLIDFGSPVVDETLVTEKYQNYCWDTLVAQTESPQNIDDAWLKDFTIPGGFKWLSGKELRDYLATLDQIYF